jgi:hypothetical protein
VPLRSSVAAARSRMLLMDMTPSLSGTRRAPDPADAGVVEKQGEIRPEFEIRPGCIRPATTRRIVWDLEKALQAPGGRAGTAC